jgi:hypothetical protein
MKLRIRHPLLLVLLLALSSVSLIRAQAPSTALDSLFIAFWPDYDDPSVLVLMTGTLPADASYPAEVTLPLPPQAEVNAVARINDEVGMADVEYQIVGDNLTFTTPDERFRVEYYTPYVEDGEWRNFDFAWNADLDVQEFTAEIQQPVNATSLTTQPPAANVGTGPSDGLTYHALPSQLIPSGTPFEMSFRYKMNSPELTAGASSPAGSNTNSLPNNTVEASSTNNWLLILAAAAGLVLVVVVTWLVATRSNANGKSRRSNKSRKPRKRSSKERSAQQAQFQFCHTCGTQASKGDQFCRNCGTELKQ